MGFSFGQLLKPVENLFHHSAGATAQPAPTPTPTPTPTPAQHAGASTPVAQSTAQVGANGLGATPTSGGPALNPLWNHLMGGPGTGPSNDGRNLDVNHIGTKVASPIQENGAMSNAMRNTPYLGDYWEALSVTHDSRHIDNNFLNGLTAVTNVGLTGPLMAAVDAPFRLFGHSLFLNKDDKN